MRAPLIVRRACHSAQDGVTMLELMVALSLSVMVVAMISSTWTSLSRHVYSQERHAQLSTSIERISTTLATELRRSRVILAWSEDQIRFVMPTGDTVTYMHDGKTLLRKGVQVHVSAPGGRVSVFRVSRNIDIGGDEERQTILLRVELCVEDNARNSTSAKLETAVRVLPGAEGGGWTF